MTMQFRVGKQPFEIVRNDGAIRIRTGGPGLRGLQGAPGAGDMLGPSSAVTSGHVAVFDGDNRHLKSGGKALPAGDLVGTNDNQALTNKTIDAAENTVSNLAASMFAPNVIDPDAAMAANSDDRLPTQKAVRAADAAQAAAMYKAATLAPVANLLVPAEPAAAAFDLLALAGLVRDDEDRAKSWAGDPNDKLQYQSPSIKYVRNRAGVLVPGTTMRCDHDPATGTGRGVRIEPQATRLNKYAEAPTSPENITVTVQAYTISFFGNGQIALSGAYTQTIAGVDAITRKTVTFTPSAGTLTVTPSGTVTDLQLEAGTSATSVIRGGEGSQVTRAADNISLPISALPWNNQAGAVFVDFVPNGPMTGQIRGIFAIERTSALPFSVVAQVQVDGSFFMRIAGANGMGVTFGKGGIAEVPRYRFALAWRSGRAVLAINGASYPFIAPPTADDLPTDPVIFRLGAVRGGSNPLGGWLQSSRYLPRDPSDSELQARTAL